MKRGPRIFISAGEPSGDVLAAELLVSLRQRFPSAEIFGICGARMRAAGAEALFGIEELSVMGFVEVLKHLPYIRRLEFSLLEAIDRREPDIAIPVSYTHLDVYKRQGLARIDLFLTKKDKKYYFNEANTLPGFTAISQYPKLWEHSGMSGQSLVSRLLDLAIDRRLQQQRLKRSKD